MSTEVKVKDTKLKDTTYVGTPGVSIKVIGLLMWHLKYYLTQKTKIVDFGPEKFFFRISGEEQKIHRDLLSLFSSREFVILI